MKARALILIAGVALVSNSFAVDPPTAGITILATFDYPGATNTGTHGINKRDEIAGSYFDSSYVTRGFIRMRDRTGYTVFSGINDKNRIAGYYEDGFVGGGVHGFIAQFH